MFKKYIGPKSFYKNVFTLIIPIMLQQLLVSLALYIDNVMINTLDKEAYNGVSAANRLMFVINFLMFGVASTASIYITQYYGAKKSLELRKSVLLSIITSIIFGIFIVLAISLLGPIVVNSYVMNNEARMYGYQYIEVIKYGAIFISLSIVLSSAFRCVKMPKISLISGVCGILVNIFLNYTLIFGNFNFPILGVKGAAIGTVISKMVEVLIFILVILFYKKVPFRKLINAFPINKELIKGFVQKGIPLILNELFWSLGMVLFAMFYTYKNDVWYNAYSYSQNISDLFFIVFSGLGAATAVFVGTKLGKNELDSAITEFNYLKGVAIIMGLVVGFLMFFTARFTASLLTKDKNTIHLVVNLLRITSIFTFIYCYNAVCFFTLRAGGDAKSAFLLDQLPTYLIGLPICIVLGVNANKWGLSIFFVYIATHTLDIVKIFLSNYFINQKKWIVNLTLTK